MTAPRTDDYAFSINGLAVMSSLEIAQWFDRDHQAVMSDIAKLFARAGIDPTAFVSRADTADGPQFCYILPERECLALVRKYPTYVHQFRSFYRRWDELDAIASERRRLAEHHRRQEAAVVEQGQHRPSHHDRLKQQRRSGEAPCQRTGRLWKEARKACLKFQEATAHRGFQRSA